MIIYQNFTDLTLKRLDRVVAIGVFDGLHRGHQKILKNCLALSRRLRAVPMAVTFNRHPHQATEGSRGQPPYLMTLRHRLRFMERLGFPECLLIHFTKSFAHISHESFLNETLLKRLGVVGICVGEDFHFGYRALGDAAYLKSQACAKRFRLNLVTPLRYQGRIVSSTWIRELIERGQIALAQKLLGRPVSVYGTVVHGFGRGQSLGFPTANLNPHHEALPRDGVYAASGFIGSKRYDGVLHVGAKPTFHEKKPTLEVHFFQFHQNLYGKNIELYFLRKIRDTCAFRNPDLLKKAIAEDCKKARNILGQKAVTLRQLL